MALVFLLTGNLRSFGQPGSVPMVGTPQSDSLRPGDPAPTFVLRNIETGDAVYLRDYAGKTLRRESRDKPKQVVVLSFWATWCEPCKKEIPIFTELADEFKEKPVRFFLVNTMEQTGRPSNTEESVKEVIKSRRYTLPCLVDALGRVAQSYRVRGLPALVVIDKSGVVREIHQGYKEGFETDLRKTLRLLSDQ